MVDAVDKKQIQIQIRRCGGDSSCQRAGYRKCKREDDTFGDEKGDDSIPVNNGNNGDTTSNGLGECTGGFLHLPDWNRIQGHYEEFYDATSQHLLEMCVCAGCGWEIGRVSDGVIYCSLDDIPNGESLMLAVVHSEHYLSDGKLLEVNGVHTILDGTKYADICHTCFQELQRIGDQKQHDNGTM